MQSNNANIFPEDPAVFLRSVVTHVDTVAQKIEDGEIASAAALSQRMSAESQQANLNADVHVIGQVMDETAAVTSAANAEHAVDEGQYLAQSNSAERHDISAQVHNILGNSDAVQAQEKSAKAAVLDQESKIQQLVAEITTNKEIAQHEIEDRTQRGVQKEMEEMAVIADEGRKAAATHDLEVGLNAPKLG